MSALFFIPLLVILVSGCDGNPSKTQTVKTGKSADAESDSTAGKNSKTDDSRLEPTLSVLFIGNSHAAPIPSVLSRIFAAEQSEEVVRCEVARGYGFLADHANRNSTLKAIKDHKWDYVVLQAQKYSTTGKYSYPIDGALKLARLAKERDAKVIMYPEWSRKSEPEEYKRIDKIHAEIADQTGATVAPVGAIWNFIGETHPNIELYAPDGNHASRVGNYLNACIFFKAITGNTPKIGADGISVEIRDKIHSAIESQVRLFSTPTN